jgi:hypothetical protein
MNYKEETELNNYKESRIFKEKLETLNNQLPALI